MQLAFVIFGLVFIRVGVLGGLRYSPNQNDIKFPLIRGQYLQRNDPCIVEKTKENGTCTLDLECTHLLSDLKSGLFATICGFENADAIICCPEPVATFRDLLPRISAIKCEEYHEISLKNTTVEYEGKKFKCPTALQDYIADGEPVSPKELPHSALIGYDDPFESKIKWGCGGTLISDQFVLTAAHCLELERSGQAKYVRLGDQDYADETEEAKPVQVDVIQRIRHFDYVDNSKYNDLALLRLEKSVEFNDFVFPACLPDSESTGPIAVASGWGSNGKSITTNLQKVELEMVTNQECNEVYMGTIDVSSEGIIEQTQLCYGARENTRGDTCQGDSGGPLGKKHDTFPCMHTVFAVTSFGVKCGSGVPGVYTRLYSYIDWIESIVWQ